MKSVLAPAPAGQSLSSFAVTPSTLRRSSGLAGLGRDREKARELQNEAIAIAQELGVKPLLERELAHGEMESD